MTDEITSSKSDGVCLTDEIPKYSHYLCFSVSVRTNKFGLKQLDRYSPEQEAVFQKIKSLHESGLGYRKIAQYLNEKGIKTARGNSWVNTQVFSVLKKYRLRQERIKNVRLKEHKMEIGKFELKWIKDTA